MLHEAELLQSDERAAQRYGRQAEELRGLLEREKEEQSQRERELARQRYVIMGGGLRVVWGSQHGGGVRHPGASGFPLQHLISTGSSPFLSTSLGWEMPVNQGHPPASDQPLVGRGRDGMGQGEEANERPKPGASLRLLCPAGVSSSWSRRSRRCSSSGAGSMRRWPRRRSGSASKRPGERADSRARAAAEGWRQPRAWEWWGWFPQARLR